MDRHKILDEVRELQHRLNELKTSISRSLHLESLPTGEKEVLFMQVGPEQYGLFVDSCETVLLICALTPIPEAPPWIKGLLNFRGELVPVIDVASRMQHRARTVVLNDLIVITSFRGHKYGLIVQGIKTIRTVTMDLVQEVPPDIPQAPYVLGVYEQKPLSVFLLSIAALLSTSDCPEVSASSSPGEMKP
ncbi:chemotaxis protein CheW [bacterium]|nr:chemotaxis protein CheW [bacterium]